MNYKVLLVDDDRIVLNGLNSIIDWNQLGFEIVGEASDGLEALKLIDELQPQLVLTDIYMRYCDGIRLMQQAKEKYPEILFIVLSCHDNFDYARNALKLGAMNYLLKSNVMHKDELIEALTNAKVVLDKNLQANVKVQELLDELQLKRPGYRKHFLQEVLGGQLKDENLIHGGFSRMNFDVGSQNYFLMLTRIEDDDGWQEQTCEIDVLDENCLDLIAKITARYGSAEAFCVRHYLYYTLIDLPPRGTLFSSEDRALSIAELIRLKIRNQLGLDSIVLIDQPVNLCQLPQADERLRQGLRRVIFLPEGGTVIQMADFSKHEKKQPVISHYPALETAFYNQEEFDALLKQLFQTAGENRHLAYFEGICDDLAKIYHRFASEYVDPEQHSDFHYLEANEFLLPRTLELALKKALGVFRELRTELINEHNSCPNQLVREVISYLDNNYTRDITLDDLEEKTNFNKYYICKKFKKETGTTITNYIIELRINKAKELLLKSSEPKRIYEIAAAVGFNDVSYFDRIFKKQTNTTPKEFAERHRRAY